MRNSPGSGAGVAATHVDGALLLAAKVGAGAMPVVVTWFEGEGMDAATPTGATGAGTTGGTGAGGGRLAAAMLGREGDGNDERHALRFNARTPRPQSSQKGERRMGSARVRQCSA